MRTRSYLIMLSIIFLLLIIDIGIQFTPAAIAKKIKNQFGDSISFSSARFLGSLIVVRDVTFKVNQEELISQAHLLADIDIMKGSITRLKVTDCFINLPDKISGNSALLNTDLLNIPISFSGGKVQLKIDKAFLSPIFFKVDSINLVPLDGFVVIEGVFSHEILGNISLSGKIDRNHFRFHVVFDEVVLSDRVYELLTDEMKIEWDSVKPQGPVKISLELTNLPVRDRLPAQAGTQTGQDFVATVLAKGIKLTYKHFPYELENVHAEAEFKQDGFLIKRLTGKAQDGFISITGEAYGYTVNDGFSLDIHADDLLIDAKFYQAIPDKAKEFVDATQVRGRLSTSGQVSRKKGEDEKIQFPIHINIKGSQFKYKDFAYELSNMHAELFLNDGLLLLHRVISQDNNPNVFITGEITFDEIESSANLKLEVENLAIDEKLRQAIPKTVNNIIDHFAIQGAVDLRLDVNNDRHSFDIKTAKASIIYHKVPFELVDVSARVHGEVHQDNQIIALDYLNARYNGSPVRMSGKFQKDFSEVSINVMNVSVDDLFVSKLPADIAVVVTKAGFKGRANFNLSIKESADKSEFLLQMTILKGVFDPGVKIEDVEGSLIASGFITKEKKNAMGKIDFSQARIHGRHFTKLSSSFNYSDDVLSFINITGNCYGGLAYGIFSIDTRGSNFQGSLNITGLDLKQYVQDISAYSGRNIKGRLDLEVVNLKGQSNDLKTITLDGKMTISQGDLWDIPIFIKIFSLDPTKFTTRAVFDAGVIVFGASDGSFQIKSLILQGENVGLVGKGTMDFGGNLNLALKTESQIGFWIFKPVDFIVNNLKNAFWGIEVRGTFDQPEVSSKLFPGFE